MEWYLSIKGKDEAGLKIILNKIMKKSECRCRILKILKA